MKLIFVPGVVLFDKERGFWLVHSTPHFPPSKSAGEFSYPSTGVINGQNFLCVTYPLELFQTIGKNSHKLRMCSSRHMDKDNIYCWERRHE